MEGVRFKWLDADCGTRVLNPEPVFSRPAASFDPNRRRRAGPCWLQWTLRRYILPAFFRIYL
jgi:hypothetical protein